METREEVIEREALQEVSTRTLVKQAIEEAKLVARAEVLHAKAELRAELRDAKLAALFLVPAGVLALCALAVVWVLIAMALPLPAVGALAIVTGFLVVVAAILVAVGLSRVPKKPMRHTVHRLEKLFPSVLEELKA